MCQNPNDPMEFSETEEGEEFWVEWHYELNGLPEGEWDQ